ncbi:hypothetical protein A3726_00345 [Erythrobacter sp. HI0037]|jgi:NADH dehydrogenase|uniref:hypothetical protein n=1 Tax=Qipengyuania flava TaxID=192812 RepID=UPI0007C3DA36|nr:hypothetical protein A3719_02700 [Erythrobacter sp. HI0020]KZY16677.1 hypothetical protein A3727_00710 [Erythrobacter sp. HI0038]KZY21466.1 hypothetical protein A3726_30295 [Erythrobacter sp. HI0037]KZY28994.1 hypothetical protein A3726_00345 [Erythrobacter sp. HI0037]
MQRIWIVGAGFSGFWSALSAVRLLDQRGETDNVEVALVAPQPEMHIAHDFTRPMLISCAHR